MRFIIWLVSAPVLTLLMGAAIANQPLEIELNRLESIDKGCRAYLVFRNPGDHNYASLKLDLVMFDDGGIINQRMVVEAAPLRSNKTTVKVFDLAGLKCDAVGRMLLNDVLSCTSDAKGETGDCFDRIGLSSRAGVDFVR